MNRANELVHRHSEGQRFFRNVGSGRHVEHTDDGPGAGGVFFEIGILHVEPQPAEKGQKTPFGPASS